MYLFSICLHIFAQTVNLNYNLHYVKKGLMYNKILQGMEAKKF